MNTIQSKVLFTVPFFVAAFGIAACEGDPPEDPGSGSQQQSGQDPPDDDDGGSGSSSSGGAAFPDGCPFNENDPCEACTLQQCGAEANACCEQPGCIEVVLCARAVGCGGIDCYTPDKCQEEIENAGLDVATSYAQTMGDCVYEKCAAECNLPAPGGEGGSGGF